MGIRFRCHHCEHDLHVKNFQAGKRGKCPSCSGKFRVPLQDAEHSLDAAEDEAEAAAAIAKSLAAIATEQLESVSTEVSGTVTEAPQTGESQEFPTEPADDQRLDDGFNSDASNMERAFDDSPSLAPPPAKPAERRIPDRFRESLEAKWYVRPSAGGQFGPASFDEFESWLIEQRVHADAFIWREGWPEWLVATKALPEVFAEVDNKTSAPGEVLPPPIPSGPPSQAVPDGNSSSGISSPGVGGVVSASGSQNALVKTPVTSVERTRLQRKQRKKRNYMIMIASLSVVAVALVVALIVVLMMQSS